MNRSRPVRSCWQTLIICGVAAALLTSATTAGAEVFLWSADMPFASGDIITVDFGATLSGITDLEAVVTGTGGVQRWTIYQGPGSPSGTVPFTMFLDCAADGGAGSAAGASSLLPILEPFSHQLAFTPAGDWTFLHDGVLTLAVDYVHGAFPDNPFCYGTGYTLPEIGHLDLIVTCDSAVAETGTSWGGIKAIFR